MDSNQTVCFRFFPPETFRALSSAAAPKLSSHVGLRQSEFWDLGHNIPTLLSALENGCF